MSNKIVSRICAVLLVICLLLTMLVGCVKQPTTPAPATIKLGAALSLTGGMAANAVQIKEALEVWIDQVNSAGGLFVKEYDKKIPVEVRMLDDESDGQKNIARLDELASWGALAYIGGIGCPSFEVGAVAAMKNEVPWCGVGCANYGAHFAGNTYLWSVFFKTVYLAPLVFDMVDTMPAPRPTKVAIWEINQADCAEAAKAWRERAAKGDYQIVFDQKYGTDQTDFSAFITGSKAAGAEIVLSYPLPPQGIAIVKQMKELDYSPKVVYWVRAPESASFGPALGALADYVFVPAGWSNQLKFSGVAEFNAAYQERYNKLPQPIAGGSWAGFQVLQSAIEKAKKLDRDSINAELAKTDMLTVSGPIKFAPEGYAIDKVVVVLQWTDKGQKQDIVFFNPVAGKYKDMLSARSPVYQPAWSAR